MTSRDRGNGQYVHSTRGVVCHCGHPLGEHTAAVYDGRRDCLADDCDCMCFKKAGAKRLAALAALAIVLSGCSALADFGGYNFDQNVADGGGIVRGGHHEAPDDAGDADTLTQDAAWKPEQNDSAVIDIPRDSGSPTGDAGSTKPYDAGSPDADCATPTTSGCSTSDSDASSAPTDAGEASPDASRDAGVSSPCGEGYTWCEGSCQLSSPFLHCNF